MKRTTPARKRVAAARKKVSAARLAAVTAKAGADERMFLAAVDALGKKV